MSRLIDADILLQSLVSKGFLPTIVRRTIEGAPTVDTVEAVMDLYCGRRLDNGETILGSAVWYDEEHVFIMPPFNNAGTFTYSQIYSLIAEPVDPSSVRRIVSANKLEEGK